jgi:membrane protein
MSPIDIGKATMREFKSDDVPNIAASVAYHAVFAIPPMIVFIIALAALVNRVTSVPVSDRLVTLINENAPGDTKDLLLNMVDNAVAQVGGGAALVGVLGALAIALWSSSNGVSTVIKAFNRAYDVDEERGFIRMKLVSIGLTLLVGSMLIMAIALLVFGKPLGDAISGWLGLGSVFDIVWGIGQFVAPIFFILLLLAVLYYFGPNVKQSFRWVSAGSVFATVVWIAVLFGFRIYLTFSNPGSAYGVMGSVVVLLFFLYVSSIVFILGAEINAVIQRRVDPETVRDLATHPEKLQDSLDVAQIGQAARDIDRRTGSRIADDIPQPILTGGPSSTVKPQKQGIGSRIASGVWSLVLAAVIARFSRKRQPRT